MDEIRKYAIYHSNTCTGESIVNEQTNDHSNSKGHAVNIKNNVGKNSKATNSNEFQSTLKKQGWTQ
jgi:hypothetical protein